MIVHVLMENILLVILMIFIYVRLNREELKTQTKDLNEPSKSTSAQLDLNLINSSTEEEELASRRHCIT